MPTRIKSSQILDGSIVASDLHSAIAVNTTAAGTFGSVIVDNFTLDGSTLALSSGDLIIDSVAGDIVLDANGNQIILKGSAGQAGFIDLATGRVDIKSSTADSQIRLQGNYGGTPINALVLDMATGGRATFNENIVAGGVISTSDTTGSTNTTSGALTVAGGIGIAENAYIGGNVAVTGTLGSAGILSVTDTTTSTSSSTGSLLVSGGAGITENLSVGGNVVITGNLQVDGTTTTVNSTTLDVADLNITVAKNSPNAAAADGAGLTVDDGSGGTEPTILYGSTPNSFNFNRNVGINTTITGGTTADTYLHIYSDEANITPLIKLQNNTAQNDSSEGVSIDFVGSGDKTAVGSRIIGTRAAAGANMDLRFHTARDAFAMIIDESQQVGLGTTDPSLKLDVATSSGAAGSFNRHLALTRGTTTGGFLGTYRAAADNNVDRMALGVGTTPTVTISSNLLDVTGGISVSEVRHSIRPSLLLDFANSKKLDPRITFTRSSTATYWDGKTTVKAEENLIPRSQTFNNWGQSASSIVADQTAAPDGTTTADKMIESSSNSWHYITTVVNAGFGPAGTFTYSLYAKVGSGRSWMLIRPSSSGNSEVVNAWFNLSTGSPGQTSSNVTSSMEDVGNGWYRCTLTYTFAFAPTHFQIMIEDGDGSTQYQGNGSNYIYIWGAQLEQRSSATTYTPTTSVPITRYQPVLQTAVAGIPRFDHDPVTGESKGLLIEGARTNIVTHSHNIAGNSFNYLLNVTTVANTAIAPDGTQSADSITPTSTSAAHYCGISGGYSAGSGTETFSVFLKANGYDKASLILANQTGAYSAYFDLTAGTIDTTGAANLSQSIVDVGNGWYRCSFSYNTTKGNPYPTIGVFQSSSGYTTSAGDGFSGVLAWGAQIEAASYPTSYIPTVGSAVTRSPDQTTVTGSSFDDIYNVSEGTVFARFMFGYNSDVDQRYIVSGGSGYARWLYTNAGDNNSIVDYDGASGAITNTTSDNVWSSAAQRSSLITLKKNIAANGQVDVGGERNATGTINTLSTEFRIGHGTGDAGQINGWMSKFAYYPKALTDAELIALTEE